MTRISKRIIGWLLGALATLAVAFGIYFAMPQSTKSVKAETAVTFESANLGDAKHDTYGTSIRFNTVGGTFAPSAFYNWVNASDYKGIADYTTVNGRTVTEINNANPGKQPITLMMQNTGSFSFLRLYIPADIMPISDVRSMGILDGWSFTDSLNEGETFTSSAVTFLRNGDTMVLADSYTALTKVTPTISDAVSGTRLHEGAGDDSWVVSIDFGDGYAFPEYDMMYDAYKTLRNAIYINGKSMEEWNAQSIAANPALGDPATYSVFPQSSTDPGHLSSFVKPVGIWGNNTGVIKLTIFKELVADAAEIVVKIGSGATVSSKGFMVADTVSKTVHTQTVNDVTSKIVLFTNAVNTDQNYATYYMATWNATSYWTPAAMTGGHLGESDRTGAGGGQTLLKYIYFNGTSVYDINKASNDALGSTHGHIKDGGTKAPIFAELSAEVGGAIKLHVPLTFAGLDKNGEGLPVQDNHTEIVLKKGLSIYDPTTGISSYLTNDIVFTNTTGGAAGNANWTKEVKAIEKETEVTGIVTKANRTDGGNNENFVIFQLSNNDYAGCNTTAITDISSLYGYIDIGGNVLSSQPGEPFFNVWNIQNSVAFRAPGLTAAQLQEVPYITIKAGAKFPSYNTQYKDAPFTYYVTTEDITFIHDVPNDTWTVGTYEEPSENTENTTVTGITTKTRTGTENWVILSLSNHDYQNTANETAITDLSCLAGSIEFLTAAGETVAFDGTTSQKLFNIWGINGSVSFRWQDAATLAGVQSITIKKGAKFPSATDSTKYYVTTEDITFYNISEDTWVSAYTEINDGWILSHASLSDIATERYTLYTNGSFWTKAPQGGCLNEYEYNGSNPVGGQLQMKYILFNGTSLYEINSTDDKTYESTHGTIANGNGQYAPILVTMGQDAGTANKSFVQLFVPTNYASGEHNTITIKEGFSVTENGTTWTVTEDITFYNQGDGTWSTEPPKEIHDITDELTFYKQAQQAAGTDTYIVYMDGNYWTCTPHSSGTATLNEYDYQGSSSVGGQEQMTYILFNGTSLYDINKSDDGTYGSSQSAITNEKTGQYAPIMTYMGLDGSRSFIQIHVPTQYAGVGEDGTGKTSAENHKTITFKTGLSFTYGSTVYTVTRDVTWYNQGDDTWSTTEPTPPAEETTVDTEVTGIETWANDTWVIVTISNNDYGSNQTGVATTPNKNLSGLVGKVELLPVEGEPITVNSISGEMYFNVGSTAGTVAFRWGEKGDLANIQSITIKAGAKFPSITTENKFFVTTEDITIYQVSADTWFTAEEKAEKVIEAGNISVSSITKVDDVYKVFVELPGITFTNTSNDTYDLNYNSPDRIAVRQKLYLNGESLYTIAAKDDSAYTYGTSPMNHENQAIFGHPAIVAAEVGTSTLQIWIFEGYVEDINNDGITFTLGSGFTFGEKVVIGDFTYSLTADVTFSIDGAEHTVENVMKGTAFGSLSIPTPEKPSTDKFIYTFSYWKDSATGEACTTVVGDGDNMYVVAIFEEKQVPGVFKTEIVSIQYSTRTKDTNGNTVQDNWLVITLSENDYESASALTQLGTDGNAIFAYLQEIGFLKGITLYGELIMAEGDVREQATLEDFYTIGNRSTMAPGNDAFINIWNKSQFDNTIAIRFGKNDGKTITDSRIDKIVIEGGTGFPSYRYISAADADKEDNDYRYELNRTIQFDFTHQNDDGRCYYSNNESTLAPKMEVGAGVRINSTDDDLSTSGIRFKTTVSKDVVIELERRLEEGWYDSVSFGTIIVPTDYLTGGQFTHAWLTANYGGAGAGFIQIEYGAGYKGDISGWEWYRYKDGDDIYTFCGSIVKLHAGNYDRKFSGRGYIKLTKNGVDYYIYADYNPANARSAAFVANAAINDETAGHTDKEKELLGKYIVDPKPTTVNQTVELTNSGMRSNALNSDGRRDITFADENYVSINAKLNSARIQLNYTTKTDVWGQFVYCSESDASTEANWVYEEFYLPANSSQHRQYLDIYRYNGVGYGLAADDLYLVKIGFATTDDDGSDERVKLISYLSYVIENGKNIVDTSAQEIYLTKYITKDYKGNDLADADLFNMTVGAHLGLGGSFTYLAKSGIFEGVVGGSTTESKLQDNSNTGSLQLSTDSSIFDAKRMVSRSGSYFAGYTYEYEDGYYGSATSSKAEDGAVNLINNSDAGRQFQQSWYANVGGVKDEDGNVTGTDGSNGYLRGYCYTEGGSYWPYNPVQAGDVVSNPSQIVDYEITSDYIYVKCRAMDWGKGYDDTKITHTNHTNTVVGGVTTRSYIENYYYINDDGTVTITNSFIDWNGFTAMEDIDYQPIELPAAYPIHTLHTYLSDTNGDGEVESYANLGSWTDAGLAQTSYSAALNGSDGGYCTSSSPSVERDRLYGMKASDWFVWANGIENSSIALGVYVPNVAQFLSGRTNSIHGSTSLSDSSTRNASSNTLFSKGLNSNMQANDLTYRSTYVNATSYTAPGINNKMKEYVQIEYSYVVSVNTLENVKKQFKELEKSGKIDNSGLDAWARADKTWVR